MKKSTVSIGICAYNEEANIAGLLQGLARQIQVNFHVCEIIVNSDGSSDSTVVEAKSVKLLDLKIIENTERKGKSYRQNQIIKEFKGDILVLLDADILITDDLFLQKLLEPFAKEAPIQTALVSCAIKPIQSKSKVGKILDKSITVKEHLLTVLNNSRNIYACHGPVMAISKQLAKKYNPGTIISDDAYLYLLCKSYKMGFVYVPSTFVWFKTPQNLTDHLKQSIRFRAGLKELMNLFSKSIVEKEFRIPLKVKISVAIKFFTETPVLFIGYTFILVLSALFSKLNLGREAMWSTAKTSKSLI